jgi:hypothetical protein
MADANNISTLMFIKDDPVVELLMKEYAILQDKMDKIGGFRFMIKGWALTLNTGTLVAAFATSLTPRPAVLLVCILLVSLWSLEYRQLKLSDIFQDRALRIENAIGRRLEDHGLRRIDFVTLRRIPGIANELRNPFDHRRPDRITTSSLSRRSKKSAMFMNSRPILAFRRSALRRRVMQSDVIFYLLLLVISALFIYSQRDKFPQSKRDGQGAHFLRTSIPSGHSRFVLLRGLDEAQNK